MKWYNDINWKLAYLEVLELQKGITWAYNTNDPKMVHKLQWKLIRSFGCRAISVRKVITNSGNKTPGVDKVIWFFFACGPLFFCTRL